MRPFSINIRGRVKNFNLPKNQPLVPLFEAIVNAIMPLVSGNPPIHLLKAK